MSEDESDFTGSDEFFLEPTLRVGGELPAPRSLEVAVHLDDDRSILVSFALLVGCNRCFFIRSGTDQGVCNSADYKDPNDGDYNVL